MDSTKYQIDYVTLSDDTIGQGAYGVVKKGYQADEVECAVKIIHSLLIKASPKHKGLLKAMILHEADVMNELSSHPNLVQFIGLYYPPSIEDANYPPYLIMELCHKGNLRSCLEVNKLDFQIKCSILHDIAKGLEHLHSHGYIHCDLTPNNILLTKDWRAKIGDVGATKLSKGKHLTDPVPGAIGYMGPEAKGSVCSYNEKLDIYSFGCIILFTISETECTDNIREWIEYVSPWPVLQKLAEQCLDNNPQKRPSAGQISKQLYLLLEPDFDAKVEESLIPFKKFHLKVVKEDHLSIIDFLSSLTKDLPGLNQATVIKCINRSYVKDFLYAQLHDVTKFEPNCNGHMDLDVDAIFTASPQHVIAVEQLNSRPSQHKQVAFNGIINVLENTNHSIVFANPFPKNSAFAKSCPRNSDDEMGVAVLVLGLLLCCLFYSLEPLLYVQPFENISKKQKYKAIRPCILEGDNLPPAKKTAYADCNISEKSEISTSSTLQVSYHKNTRELQDERNEKKSPVNNDRRLPCCNGSLKTCQSNTDIKYLPIFGFIVFLFFTVCLINSIFVNGFNNSKHTSSKVRINFLPVVAQNSTLTKSDHCIVDEYPTSALLLDLNLQCKVQHCAINNTLLHNSMICNNDLSSNYSRRLDNKEGNIVNLYIRRKVSLIQLAQCLPDPLILCPHYTHAVCQLVNTSGLGVKKFRLHQNDRSMVMQDDVSSSNSVAHSNRLSLKEHPQCKLLNQSTNITLSNSYSNHLPLGSNIINVASNNSTSFPFAKTIKDIQPELFRSLVTLTTALPYNSFTQNNRTLFTQEGLADMPKILNPSKTGISRLKGERCFDKVIASSSTIRSLPNSNNTWHKLLHGEFEKYTHVIINFDKLLDAILSVPLNATSIVRLPNIDKLLPPHSSNSVMFNVVIMIKFLNIVKSKFKITVMQCRLQNLIPFVVLHVYICVKWLIIIPLTNIKQKLLLLIQCCNLYLKKLHRPLICGNNIYCPNNPTSFYNACQHVSLCKQQQVMFIDLTKHRHFSDSWCKKYQENLSRPRIISFKVALNNESLLGFCDIIYAKFPFVLIGHLSFTKESYLLVLLQLLINGRHGCISLPITVLKNYSIPMINCGKLTTLPTGLSLTKHSDIALAIYQVDDTAQLHDILHAHYLESQWYYSNIKWTRSIISSVIYCLCPMQTIYVISGLQMTSLFSQKINKETNEAALAMHNTVYITFNHKDQKHCITKGDTDIANGHFNSYMYIQYKRQERDNSADCEEGIIHDCLPKSDHHMHDYDHDNNNHSCVSQNDQDDNHDDNQSNHTYDDHKDDYDHDHDSNDDDHAENGDNDHYDNHGDSNADDHDVNGYNHDDNCNNDDDDDDDHTDNDNNDCHHDSHGDDYDDNDYDHADNHDDDDNINNNDEDDDDNDDQYDSHDDSNYNNHDDNHDDKEDDNNHVHDATKFALTFSYCCLLLFKILLSFLHCRSYHIFLRQILRCRNWIWYVKHLLCRCIKVERISDKSYCNTFKPNYQHMLIHVLNTETTAAVVQTYILRRYNCYVIVHNKKLTYFAFQSSSLCYNITANFQASHVVNQIMWILDELRFNNNNLQNYHQGDDSCIIHLISNHLMCMSVQTRQIFQLFWLPFGCHKILATVIFLCQVQCGQSQFSIIATRFQNVNNIKIAKLNEVRWLNWNDCYLLYNFSGWVSCRIADEWLQRPPEDITEQLTFICTMQENDNLMLYFSIQNHMHLAEIQIRNLIGWLETHLFASTYNFLRLRCIYNNLLPSVFFTDSKALCPTAIAEKCIMHPHTILQLARGTRQSKLDLKTILVEVRIPARETILLEATIHLLDIPDDRGDVVEIAPGCTLESLRTSIADGSATQLVILCATYNICIHQPAQRKLSLDSMPGHGSNLLIQSNCVSWFMPVNSPFCHQNLLDGIRNDPDINVSYYILCLIFHHNVYIIL